MKFVSKKGAHTFLRTMRGGLLSFSNELCCNVMNPCRQLADLEERLDEITVDEMLELYPQLAQEIKDEIEAGEYSKTDAGHKIAVEG